MIFIGGSIKCLPPSMPYLTTCKTGKILEKAGKFKITKDHIKDYETSC
jgi:hypothetical protein